MFPNRLAFAALGVACMAAAAAGGYYASRQSAPQAPAAAVAAAPVPAVADKPLQEAGATLAEPAQTPVASSANAVMPKPPAAAPAATPPKRVEPPARPAPPATRSARKQPAPEPQVGDHGPAPVQAPPAVPPPPVAVEPPAPHAEERMAPEPLRAPDPPEKSFEELVVAADAVIGLETETPVSSEHARVEDRVDARVTRDVRVSDRVAIPAGARAIGSVMQVERGGKFKEVARLGIRFHTLVLGDGTRLPISTDTIWRYGEAPGNGSAARIGGAAVGGAIIGAILGGARGAVIGATTGAGAGTAAVAAGDRSAATLQPRTPLTVRLVSPVTVTIER